MSAGSSPCQGQDQTRGEWRRGLGRGERFTAAPSQPLVLEKGGAQGISLLLPLCRPPTALMRDESHPGIKLPMVCDVTGAGAGAALLQSEGSGCAALKLGRVGVRAVVLG